MRQTQKLLIPVLLFIAFVAIAEILIQKQIIPAFVLPAPSEVWQTLNEHFAEYFRATLITLTEALVGLLLSFVVGVSTALLMTSSKNIEAALHPYALFFQTVPLISIAPLLVIWFGYGMGTVVISSFIISVFPMITNTLAGLKSTEFALLDLFRLYGATRLQTLLKLRLPSAVPHIVTGLRISTGLAMIGAIVGEFIAGGGLGGLIDSSRSQQRIDKVFAAVLICSLTGIFLVGMINFLVRAFLSRWRELQT
ncbi:MAG: ABC transporter permease [Bdellovibrionales bacterium]